jgi:hypothetical protein
VSQGWQGILSHLGACPVTLGKLELACRSVARAQLGDEGGLEFWRLPPQNQSALVAGEFLPFTGREIAQLEPPDPLAHQAAR